MRVQLLYFPGCPNAEPARRALARCVTAVGVSAVVEEVDVSSPDAPASARGWGSPTILIDGLDVGGSLPGTGASCRIYHRGGVPTDEQIMALLRARGDSDD